MAEGANRLRERVKRLIEEHMNQFSAEAQAAAQEWITAYEDGDKTLATSDKLSAAMSKETSAVAKEIMAMKPYFTKSHNGFSV